MKKKLCESCGRDHSKQKPWLVTAVKDEMTTQGGAGTKVVLDPKTNHAQSLKDIDCLRLDLENTKGEKQSFWMTPDEALEIAGCLSSAVSFWLNFKYQPYMTKFNRRRNDLTKKHLDSKPRKGKRHKQHLT